jgi:hypothetical protein
VEATPTGKGEETEDVPLTKPTTPRRRNLTLAAVPVVLTALLASPAIGDPVPAPPSVDEVTNGVDTVADSAVVPSPSVADTASGAIDTVTDAVSGATDTVSGATGQQPAGAAAAGDTISSTTGGAETGGAGGTVRERSATSLGGVQGAGGRTATREGGEAVPCDPQTGTCGSVPSGGPLADAVGRILGFLAQTGIALLGWIALAVGLGALGAFLLGSSRSRKPRGRATASGRS